MTRARPRVSISKSQAGRKTVYTVKVDMGKTVETERLATQTK